MKRTLLIPILLIFINSINLFADSIPGGYVSGTWTAAGSPYLIQGDITIHGDSTLTIEPGVVVNFQGTYKFTVNGLLEAIGTETDSIHFTAVTFWKGLIFDYAPDSSHLAYCTIRGSTDMGGILCTNSSNPVITHSTISNNNGTFGGGVYLINSNPRLSYCAISNNASYNYGGGIRIESSSPLISYCSIIGNNGSSGGGGIYITGGNPLINNCTISDNKAGNGGAISFLWGQCTITECIITANTALGLYGGGIYVNASIGGSVTINNSIISNCNAPSGGGIYVEKVDTLSIMGSTLESNSVSQFGGGGAMWINQAGTVSITGTTIDDNSCGALPGGVIYSVNCSNLVIDHCDVVNNHAASAEGGIYLNGATTLNIKNSIFRGQMGPDILFGAYTSASVSYSDFYGGSFYGGPPGLGVIDTINTNGDSCDVYSNIYLDPLFVDFSNGDYNLTESSPCIDAGDPASSHDPDGTITDMGRYFFDQGGTGIAGGYVSGTWTASSSPYRILGDITIHTDSTLTIEPGVEVNFQGHYKFNVEGMIYAVGTEQDSICFTAADTNAGWWGVRFTDAPDGSQLSYCIFQYGRATGGGIQDKLGGAIYAHSSRPQITHCTITNNIAENRGAAIFVDGTPAGPFPQIFHCNINNNSATTGHGGGVYFSAGPFDISDCIISGNIAGGFGGGLYIESGATDTVNISNCTVSDDSSAEYGGGIYVANGYTFINGCTIDNNRARLTGGGLYNGGYLNLINSTLQGNVSWGGLLDYETGGGGIIVYKSTLVDSCVITGNVSHTGSYPSYGGGILLRGASYSVEVTNSKIMNNTADLCGGMIFYANNATLAYCEISNNQAFLGTGGAQIQSWNSTTDHCTFSENVGVGTGGFYINNDADISNSIFSWNSPTAISFSSSGTKTIEYSDFFGNDVDTTGSGLTGFGVLVTTNYNGDSCDVYSNIFLDPLFADTSASDFHLTGFSPCIDAGDPASPLDPDSTVTDMGCYYFDQGSVAVQPNDFSENTIIRSFTLYQNYPNPFNPVTTIGFIVGTRHAVSLRVYDLLGREVATLVSEKLPAGNYTRQWNATGMPSGVYFYRLQAGSYTETKKLILLK